MLSRESEQYPNYSMRLFELHLVIGVETWQLVVFSFGDQHRDIFVADAPVFTFCGYESRRGSCKVLQFLGKAPMYADVITLPTVRPALLVLGASFLGIV